MSWLGSLLSKLFSKERRRAQRYSGADLVAYFWTGGHSEPCTIRDISMSGLFLNTAEHWYPGTLVRLVVQQKDVSKDRLAGKDITGRVITVQSMVVHCNEGVGLAFFFIERKGRDKISNQGMGASRAEMEKFLEPYLLQAK